TIDFEPAPKGVPRIGVQFEIDANGILHVLARDTRTGRQTVVEMKSAVDVDDAAVQRMVEESVEHAFEDLAARRWIEAALGAEEAGAAKRKGGAGRGARRRRWGRRGRGWRTAGESLRRAGGNRWRRRWPWWRTPWARKTRRP